MGRGLNVTSPFRGCRSASVGSRAQDLAMSIVRVRRKALSATPSKGMSLRSTFPAPRGPRLQLPRKLVAFKRITGERDPPVDLAVEKSARVQLVACTPQSGSRLHHRARPFLRT